MRTPTPQVDGADRTLFVRVAPSHGSTKKKRNRVHVVIEERPGKLAKKSDGHLLVLAIPLNFEKVPPHCFRQEKGRRYHP